MDELNKFGLVELNESSLDEINGGDTSISLDLSDLFDNISDLLNAILSDVAGLLGTLLGAVTGVVGGAL